jgi:hypothetical protein
MEAIIAPVSVELLEAELTPDKLLRKTNKSNNEIYVITHHDSPNVMREIGRLREVSFRTSGGGSGLGCDVDIYDTMEVPYKQLIVWNPDDREIIGGYRFLHGADVTYDENGVPMLTSSHLFKYSEKFLKEYLPYTIELGRSFVRPEYQSTKMGAKSLFALDNLWDGLGALTVALPNTKYFFGKATMYPSFGEEPSCLLYYFLSKYFPDEEALVIPHRPMPVNMDVEKMKALRERVEAMVARVEEISKETPLFKDFHARRLVECSGYLIITYLLAQQASEVEEYASDAKVFAKLAEAYINGAEAYVMNSTAEDVALISEVENQF